MQPFQYDSRHHIQTPCNIHTAVTIRFTASRSKDESLYAHGNKTWQASCNHCTAICNQRFNKQIKLRTHEQPLVAEHRGGTDSTLKRPLPHPPHTRYLSSPAAATLPGKRHGFMLRLSLQHKLYATFMQPSRCDLQLEMQQMQRTTRTWATTRCRTQIRNRFHVETTPAAPAAHTRYLSSPAAATLHRKMHGLVLRKFLSTQAPCNIHTAITRSATRDATNA